MNPADSSRHGLAIIAETEYGVTPATPALARTRHTSCTLALTKTSTVSAEIDPNRQIKDFRHGTKQVGGDVGFELSYGTFDLLLEAALCGDWIPEGVIADDTLSAVAATSQFADSGNGMVLAGFKVGRLVEVTGFTDVANNGTFLITAVAAGYIAVTKPDGSPAGLVDEAAGDAVEITTEAEILKAGVERRSFTMERHFSDLVEADKPYHRFTGCIVNTFGLTLTPDAVITGTFGIIGQGQTLAGTPVTGATYTPQTSTRVFDAFTGSLTEGGSPLAAITEMSLTLENGVTPRFVLFSDETILPGIGQSNLTGSVTVFFGSSAMLEKFINETPSSLEFTLEDLHGNQYIFNLPLISYTGGQPDTTAGGQSVTLTMPLQAIYDPTSDTNVSIVRIPAAA